MSTDEKLPKDAPAIPASPPGPEPERPKPEGDWKQAVGDALKKKKPATGWPEPRGRYGNKKTRTTSK